MTGILTRGEDQDTNIYWRKNLWRHGEEMVIHKSKSEISEEANSKDIVILSFYFP